MSFLVSNFSALVSKDYGMQRCGIKVWDQDVSSLHEKGNVKKTTQKGTVDSSCKVLGCYLDFET